MSTTYEKLSIYDILNKVAVINPELLAFVAPYGSFYWDVCNKAYPNRTFPTIQSALLALPNSTTTNDKSVYNNIPAFMYVSPHTISVVDTPASKIIIPLNKSGLEIYFDDTIINATAAITANDAPIEVQGKNVKITFGGSVPQITTNVASQTGTAMIVGGTLSTEGDGEGLICKGLVAGSYLTAGDFTSVLQLRGAVSPTFIDCDFRGSTGTTEGIIWISQASDGAGYTRNGDRAKFIKCRSIAQSDTGNVARPLRVGANNNNGAIIGGIYATSSATTKSALIASEDWSLGGGALFMNAGAVGANNPVDLTATRINIGEAYVKNSTGTTPATLLDQTNV